MALYIIQPWNIVEIYYYRTRERKIYNTYYIYILGYVFHSHLWVLLFYLSVHSAYADNANGHPVFFPHTLKIFENK